MATAAHTAVVKVSTTSGGSYTEVDGLNDASISRLRELLDTTDFKDTSGARTRIYGLKDNSFSLAGDYEASDTNGQNAIRSAFDNGTDLFIQFLPDGTNGWQVQILVESFDVSTAVDGKAEFSCSLQATGAVTILPA